MLQLKWQCTSSGSSFTLSAGIVGIASQMPARQSLSACRQAKLRQHLRTRPIAFTKQVRRCWDKRLAIGGNELSTPVLVCFDRFWEPALGSGASLFANCSYLLRDCSKASSQICEQPARKLRRRPDYALTHTRRRLTAFRDSLFSTPGSLFLRFLLTHSRPFYYPFTSDVLPLSLWQGVVKG